ncbi:endolytic transglycosylase MltG [Paenibacillus chartarius]|uniref:Endolytic murein transglycosylase n=1 Tax=Paenibacillus chartarius TaxID=747481 RepID=A0ABV6DIP4_9BACL
MEPTQQKPKRSAWRIVGAVLALLVLTAAGAATGLGLYVSQALRPVPGTGHEIKVDIAPGSRPAQIAEVLETNGIIRDARIFTYYLKWKKEGSRFQAGAYALTPGMSLNDIIAKLNAGDTIKAETLKLTVPEGFTVVQIAEKLAQTTGKPADDVLRLLDQPAPYTGSVIAAIPEGAAIKHRLEGYLFPETYEFKLGTGPEEMIARMLAETEARIGSVAGWQERMQKLGFSLHQLLTVASLIEREVVVDEERPIVAGVIMNRLKMNMPLQIDATVQYLFDKPKERVLEKDLQIESPYNTYLNPGLPPGPIASPSLASIEAALSPAETKYLFYVTKKDGSKGHLFAETYEEHKKNIAASKAQEGK